MPSKGPAGAVIYSTACRRLFRVPPTAASPRSSRGRTSGALRRRANVKERASKSWNRKTNI